MELPKELHTEITQYCTLNNISLVDDFIIKLIKQGFTVEKFGATPQAREKIVEKIVNVPVEVIVEKIVERTVEVPVTMIDTEMSDALKEQIAFVGKLRSELLDSMNQTELLKKQLEEKNKNKKDIYGEG